MLVFFNRETKLYYKQGDNKWTAGENNLKGKILKEK